MPLSHDTAKRIAERARAAEDVETVVVDDGRRILIGPHKDYAGKVMWYNVMREGKGWQLAEREHGMRAETREAALTVAKDLAGRARGAEGPMSVRPLDVRPMDVRPMAARPMDRVPGSGLAARVAARTRGDTTEEQAVVRHKSVALAIMMAEEMGLNVGTDAYYQDPATWITVIARGDPTTLKAWRDALSRRLSADVMAGR